MFVRHKLTNTQIGNIILLQYRVTIELQQDYPTIWRINAALFIALFMLLPISRMSTSKVRLLSFNEEDEESDVPLAVQFKMKQDLRPQSSTPSSNKSSNSSSKPSVVSMEVSYERSSYSKEALEDLRKAQKFVPVTHVQQNGDETLMSTAEPGIITDEVILSGDAAEEFEKRCLNDDKDSSQEMRKEKVALYLNRIPFVEKKLSKQAEIREAIETQDSIDVEWESNIFKRSKISESSQATISANSIRKLGFGSDGITPMDIIEHLDTEIFKCTDALSVRNRQIEKLSTELRISTTASQVIHGDSSRIIEMLEMLVTILKSDVEYKDQFFGNEQLRDECLMIVKDISEFYDQSNHIRELVETINSQFRERET